MHNRRKHGWIALILLFLGGVLAVALHFRQPVLMDRSVRVFDLVTSDSSAGYYDWLSDHELLYFRANGNLCRLDTRTGAVTDLSALTHQFNSANLSHQFVLSPDGKWILWQYYNYSLFAGATDGSKWIEWPGIGSTGELFWMPDSQRWLQAGNDGAMYTQIDIHSIANPHQSQTISPLAHGLQGLEILAVRSDDTILARTRDTMTFTTPIRGNAYILCPNYSDTQNLSIWGLHDLKPQRQFTIHLPGLVREVKVPPQGDRLVWLLQARAPSGLSALLQRWIPMRRAEDRLSMTLYVSQLDGSQLHEIGQVVTNPQSTGSLIAGLRWLPSGKRLSFTYDEALWTVPTE